MRKRYSVVMRGTAGSVRDQTTVLSRHRTEAAAREAAEAERRRLYVVRPAEAPSYRIAIYRDEGDLILDEPAVPAGASAPSEVVLPLEGPKEGAGDEPEPEPEPDEPEEGLVALDDAPPASDEEPVPEGPVPDDVIERFAASLDRERERDERRRNDPEE